MMDALPSPAPDGAFRFSWYGRLARSRSPYYIPNAPKREEKARACRLFFRRGA